MNDRFEQAVNQLYQILMDHQFSLSPEMLVALSEPLAQMDHELVRRKALDEKVIEITTELNSRVQLRRKSDISDREKARRLDEIVFQSRHYFKAWLAEHDIALKDLRDLEALGFEGLAASVQKIQLRERARHFASMAHEHAQVLKLAGVDDVTCRCDYCKFSSELLNESPERMRKEQDEQKNNVKPA